MLDKLITYVCVGTRLYIMSCLLRELTASQFVSSATRSDTGSYDSLDLIQSLVPTHYVCNGYVFGFHVFMICLYLSYPSKKSIT